MRKEECVQNEDISRRIKDLQSMKDSYIQQQNTTKLKYVEINSKEYISISEYFWRGIYASAIHSNGNEIMKLQQEILELKEQLKKAVLA